MAQDITFAGEKLFATQAQLNQALDIDTFIFANVPGQDPTAAIDRNEGLPPVAQRVHTQAVQQKGKINDNIVVYSTVLESITGPFEFNWVGLYSSVHQKLIAVQHIPTVNKTTTVGGAAGNTLNRNFGIEYSGIAALTDITVDAQTWQLDFSARLEGVDTLHRQLAREMNGDNWFTNQNFQVFHYLSDTFKVNAGFGYVYGLRVELNNHIYLTADSYPQNVYIDAWMDGDASSTWKPQHDIVMTNQSKSSYVDESGRQHFILKIAEINSVEDCVDLRDVFNFKMLKFNRKYQTVADAIAALNQETNANLNELVASKDKIETVWHNATTKKGGAEYIIKTAEQAGNDNDIVDGDFNFYVGLGNSHVAVLQHDVVLDLAMGGFHPALKSDWSDFLDAAFDKSKSIYSEFVKDGAIKISRSVSIPADTVIDLNLTRFEKTENFNVNESKTIFWFDGHNSKLKGIDGSSVVGSQEKLVGFKPGVKNCTEENCHSPLSRLILNEGINNTNVSNTLSRLTQKYGGAADTKAKVIEFDVLTTVLAGNGDVRRVRYFPSMCRIVHIEVFDLTGESANDFAFQLLAKQGGVLAEVYSRSRQNSSINQGVNIDWVHEDFDDILYCRLTNYDVVPDTMRVKITYEIDKRANGQVAWFYSSPNDFLKPHRSNANSFAQAVRSIEYRSYVDGAGMEVSNAVPDRKVDTNYNWPHVTVPTPQGSRDVNETTELKFYLNYSAAQALNDGVTHLRIRLHEAPAIKCTVINGWLSQAYDGAPIPHLSTLGLQPDIEIDIPESGVDDFEGQVILIPLDIKAMQYGVLQAKSYDFNFFYLTFYQNKPDHLAIEWGDEWSFVIDFIRDYS